MSDYTQLMSLITDWRLGQGGGMTNTALERETTENQTAQGEEVTPDIIWQMGDTGLYTNPTRLYSNEREGYTANGTQGYIAPTC